jgi:type IV secretory pathway TrbL component
MKALCLALLVLFPCAAFGQALLVSPAASYGTAISDNVKSECALGQTQTEAVLKHLGAAGITAQAAGSDAVPAQGRYLQLRIESAISGGNAFVGHRKQVTTSARLFENGKEIAQTTQSRDSTGGFFGGYKGSCNVLRRCALVVGKDIAAWVKAQPAK